MAIDLELADSVAAGHRYAACLASGTPCGHDPACQEDYERHQSGPTEFRYRRFEDINESMQLTGMAYAAEPSPWPSPAEDTAEEREAADLRGRSQTVPGRTGIPAFKLRSNDCWLVTPREIDEALAAYAVAPADLRARLEADPKWVAWLDWLALAREHGGFEAQ